MKSSRKGGEYKLKKRVLSILLVIFVLFSSFPASTVQAANKKLKLETAKAAALSTDSKYQQLQNKLALTKVKYVQSVKKLKLKEKNQKTFRWSPLLSFKFPESPSLADEFEYAYKPLELQSQIDNLKHQISDYVYEIYKNVELEFIKVYVLQEKIGFNEDRIESYQATLDKNKARLIIGQANQSDIDAIEKKLDKLKSTLASDKRNFEAEKQKLSDMIGIDVSTSYDFMSPFVDAQLDRNMVDKLIDNTLNYDDSYYQAQTTTANALLALETNYRLMKQQYGSDMDMIDSFINTAKKGGKLDSAAFKSRYDELLDKVDQPWQGSIRILFIKIPKEWFKGSIDGVRYVEDEPYALYESALEYQNACKDEESLKKELTQNVKDNFENYISTRNAAESLKKDVASKKEELQKAAAQNTAGMMTYEEYTAVQEEYEDLQIDLLDAEAAYSETLYTFDRLTCGAISSYLNGTSALLASAEGGESYVVADEGEGVYYYIRSLVSNNMFEFGISVQEDFDIEIESYELWVDGIRIGERTAVDKQIRHLALDLQSVERVFVRLFDDKSVIDDCDIDPGVYSGKLNITKNYRVETMEKTQVATYTTQTDSMGMFVLNIKPEPEEQSVFFNIKDSNGEYLISDAKIKVTDSFKYLAMAESSLDDLTICFYGEDEKLLYEAKFRTSDKTIHKLK